MGCQTADADAATVAQSANGSSHYSLNVHLTCDLTSSLVCARPTGEHSPNSKQVCIIKFLHDSRGSHHDKMLHRRAFSSRERSGEHATYVPGASCVELKLHNKLDKSPHRSSPATSRDTTSTSSLQIPCQGTGAVSNQPVVVGAWHVALGGPVEGQ